MNQKPENPASGAVPAASRADRLAAALRDNLKRRKEQGKARARPATDSRDPGPDEPGAVRRDIPA